MRKTLSAGFTLIELLVVIAIIGILAGIMFPTITEALENANSTKLTSAGGNIAKGIFQENTQREANNDGEIWPGAEYDIYDETGKKAKEVTSTTYTTSSDYFDDLITYSVVSSLQLGFFAGGGVPQPRGDDKLADGNGKYNVWSCIAVQGGNVSGDPPFIFTRNLKPNKTGLADNKLIDSDERWPAANEVWKTDFAKPFGTSRCIIVTRGGSASQIRSKDMAPSKFWGDAKFTSVDKVAALGPTEKIL